MKKQPRVIGSWWGNSTPETPVQDLRARCSPDSELMWSEEWERTPWCSCYGLRCHRAIITICRLIGIKDMYAKVSGSVNMINLTCGVFRGLSRQETHQQLADKKGLHVVEFREECGPLPIVVASPRGALRKDPEPEEEVSDVKLDWEEVKAAQGMKRSVWSRLKRAAT